MSEAEKKEQKLQAHVSHVLQDLQEAAQGRLVRQELIRRIENLEPQTPRRLLVYVGNIDHPAGDLSPADIVPLANALASVGKVPYLDVLLHTPGGSGDMAEKFVEMCRSHCSPYGFRVIVPNMAKSAGTLIALGADTIVMGYCSEVGPIDPQIQIAVGNVLQTVSAWTFIRTRDVLQEKVQQAIARGEDPTVFLQQLAGLDPVFVTHCEQLMTFATQLVRKFIFARIPNLKLAEERTKQLVDFLGDVEQHISHGRLISVRELLQKFPAELHVVELAEDDASWQLYWELYVRCEVFLKQGEPKAKLIETADVSIPFN